MNIDRDSPTSVAATIRDDDGKLGLIVMVAQLEAAKIDRDLSVRSIAYALRSLIGERP